MAVAILGFPVDKLPLSAARKIVEGGRIACNAAGIPLAGGHSIDSPEPIFGLAVTGTVAVGKRSIRWGEKIRKPANSKTDRLNRGMNIPID